MNHPEWDVNIDQILTSSDTDKFIVEKNKEGIKFKLMEKTV